jgi:CheY-like chemotaxis protein
MEHCDRSVLRQERATADIPVFHFAENDARPFYKARVLVVEDNLVNQKVIVQMLEKRGYEAEVASNGLEAVGRIATTRYDFVLMDCQMPVMDGYEATREIRRSEGEMRHTPIIAVTANAMMGDREKCLEAGMDDYLTKPVKIEALEAAIARWSKTDAPEAAPPIRSSERRIDDDVIDQTALDALRELEDGASDILRELVEIYIDDAPGYITALREAILAADPHQMERTAHTLKGSSASLGARRLVAACLDMERLGRGGSMEGSQEMLARVEREFHSASQVLRLLI